MEKERVGGVISINVCGGAFSLWPVGSLARRPITSPSSRSLHPLPPSRAKGPLPQRPLRHFLLPLPLLRLLPHRQMPLFRRHGRRDEEL